MRLNVLKSKLHRITVTEADLHYDGSFTLDEELMEAANLVPYERIELYDVTNGSRIATYVIPGRAGSRVACANGAAAHQIHAGDVVILCAYAEIEADEAALHRPVVVFVDENNDPRSVPLQAEAG